MGELAVLVPMLNRPHQVEPMLDSLLATCPQATPYFATTEDHKEVRKEINRLGYDYHDVPLHEKGDMARKINYLYTITDEPHLFMGAGDIKFHDGWYEAILDKLEGRVQVVGTNDLGNEQVLAGLHSTHTFFTRKYIEKYGVIDEPGKVLCEIYPHEFCDNEFVQTAIAHGAWAMAMDSIVEHMHPDFGKEEWDESYSAQQERLRIGWWYYKKRRKMWDKLIASRERLAKRRGF